MRDLVLGLATLALVYRAWSKKSLTHAGIIAAALTAVVHALHPWSVFFALLASFFLTGTFVTKVKHAQKSTLTTSSIGGSTASTPSPRTATQVLCNSLPASILIALHAFYLSSSSSHAASDCLAAPTTARPSTALADALPYGIIASYASAAADTFSSELGILSSSPPILITDLRALLSFSPRRVPHGTNGGVTPAGLLAGLVGAALMGLVAAAGTPFCGGGQWPLADRAALVAGAAAWGLAGSVLDSVLGGLLQASVVDGRTGKVVEGEGGVKVLYGRGGSGKGRRVVAGRDILSNNGVNLLMLSAMAAGAVGVAWALMAWKV